MKEKMTIKEFFKTNGSKFAIHCDTEEKAKKLLRAFDRAGYCWCTGGSYRVYTNWEMYKENTCYTNDGGFQNLEYYKRYGYNGYTVVAFDDIVIKDESSEHKNMSYDKIIQIETELGISLVALFKALKKGIYQKELHFQHRGTHLDPKYLRLNLWDECLEWTDIWNGGDVYEYYFSDYGKTWALTKEELIGKGE